jgi:hypothetical protein
MTTEANTPAAMLPRMAFSWSKKEQKINYCHGIGQIAQNVIYHMLLV